MKRRYYSRSLFKLKLKKQTVYSLSAVFFIGCAGITALSFTQQGVFLSRIYALLVEVFGWGILFLPIVLGLFSLLFLHLKLRFTKPNVIFGTILLWFSLLSLTQAGLVGGSVWSSIEELVTGAGAFLILFGVAVIGLTVLADTSLDQFLLWLIKIFLGISNFFKTYLFGGILRNKKKPVFVQEKLPIKVRGEEKIVKPPMAFPPVTPELGTAVIANIANSGIWDYPPLTLLSERPGQKADRGDLKGNAATIEKTLDSLELPPELLK